MTTTPETERSIKILKITHHIRKYIKKETADLKLTEEGEIHFAAGVLCHLAAMQILSEHNFSGEDKDYLFVNFGEGVKILLQTYEKLIT